MCALPWPPVADIRIRACSKARTHRWEDGDVSDDVTVQRGRLVDLLAEAGHVRTERVAEAFRTVPRHLFLPGVEPADAYADEAIVTKRQSDGLPISSSSQPAIMAEMLEQLDVEPGQRVLEIGTGTGYNAALLAYLVGTTGAVTTLDIDTDLVEQARGQLQAAGVTGVNAVCADGAAGWPGGAPYDRVIVTAAAWDVEPAWVGQLADRGRLVLPLSLRGVQLSVAFEALDDHLVSRSVMGCGFMPLRGALAGPDQPRPLGDQPGLFVHLADDRPIDLSALNAALHQPGAQMTTGVAVTAGQVLAELGLWLALHDPDAGRLVALGDAGLVPALSAFPGMTSTTALIGAQALAALAGPDTAAPTDSFTIGVRPFGPDGTDLAQRLAAHVRAWDAAGRPSTAKLGIRAYPLHEAPADPATFVLDKRHTRLLIDW